MANREQQAMEFFINKGWTKQQAAGIVGNLAWESGGLNENVHEKGNTQEGYGLAQWGPARQKDFSNKYGRSIEGSSFEEQLEFVNYEMTEGDYKKAGQALAKENTASGSAVVVRQLYEKPREDVAHDEKRIANAQRLENGEYREPAVKHSPVSEGTNTAGTNTATQESSAPALNGAYSVSSDKLSNFTGNTGIGNVVEVSSGGPTKSQTTRNVLEKFSSYNYVITLSCLPPDLLNFPEAIDSYKNSHLGIIVLRSGGGDPDNRVSTGYANEFYNPEGKFEYYIDNLVLNSYIAPIDKNTKGTNINQVTFDIFEPYSTGIFIQTLELAATTAGYFDFRTAPYLLTIEFIGYDSNGNIIPSEDELNRHIPIKISEIKMSATGSGSKYSILGSAFNQQSLINMNNLIKEDMTISGGTVAEILQTGEHSLQLWLNKKLQYVASNGGPDEKVKSVPDEIVIMFPKTDDSSDSTVIGTQDDGQSLTTSSSSGNGTMNIESKLTLTRGVNSLLSQTSQSLNEIGSASMDFTMNTGGQPQITTDNEAQPESAHPVNRSKIKFDADKRSFQFPQGTSILSAIEEVILRSSFCAKTIETRDSSGMIKWFRIETQVYILQSNTKNYNRGNLPKLMIFRVVPYYVHGGFFDAPTSKPPGYDVLKRLVSKEYNYLHTGKNTDLINMDLTFMGATFRPIPADKSRNAWSTLPQSVGIGADNEAIPMIALNDAVQKDPMNGVVQLGALNDIYKNAGGGPNDTYRTLVVRAFQNSLFDSAADLQEATIEILGDPYFIADSGLGNFIDDPASFNENKRGTVNHQSGEVDILINYKVRVDYAPDTGILEDAAQYSTIPGFSGLYKVNQVENTFNKGKFTQKLLTTRRPLQNPEEVTVGPKETAAPSTAKSIADDGNKLSCTIDDAKKSSLESTDRGFANSVFQLGLQEETAVSSKGKSISQFIQGLPL